MYPTSYSLLRSRTFWTIIVMFIVGGGNAIVQFMPADLQAGLMAVLGFLASYFHKDTAVAAGATN